MGRARLTRRAARRVQCSMGANRLHRNASRSLFIVLSDGQWCAYIHELAIIQMPVHMDIPSAQPMNLLDLPNEILSIIIEYLSTIDVFYSFVGVTERLDQLVLHPFSTRSVNMTCLRMELLPERIYSLDRRALATLCHDVLPRIRHHITEIFVDAFAIYAVLHAIEYPELCSLSFIDIGDPYVLDFLRRKTVLARIPGERNSISEHTQLLICRSRVRRRDRSGQTAPRSNHRFDHRFDEQQR